MTHKKEFIERRKHKRFKVKSGAVAAMIRISPAKPDQTKDMSMGENAFATTTPKYIQMGQIINISKGGLAFRYIDSEDESRESFELDILFAQNSFYFKNAPFKTVWVSGAVSNPSFSPLKTKQRGMQFGKMVPHQIPQLDYFLQKYTIR